MNYYYIAKYFHLIGVVMMLGATLCNGLIHLSAIKNQSLTGKLNSLENIMIINKVLMIPGFILLIGAGILLISQGHFGIQKLNWLQVSILMTIFLVLEFIWGYRLEGKLEKLTKNQLRETDLSYGRTYKAILSIAIPIGSSATVISFIIIYLMLIKPF